MATSKRLKAWVRYDGQNKIVPSSLILQANKPKVGTWEEILSDLCCTTTTTTVYCVYCTLYRNDGPDLLVLFDALPCGATGMSDIELDPGGSACVQFYNTSSGTGPLTNLGRCSP